MAQGLGKNSPVVLTLGKANYEALIDRHGQWLRWRVSRKCSCVQKATQQPDLRCPKCGGLGTTYTYQKDAIYIETLIMKDEYMAAVSAEFENAELVAIRDKNNALVQGKKSGRYIVLDEPKNKDFALYVEMVQKTAKTLKLAKCDKIGSGYYRIEGLRVSKNLDDLYHTAPSDILKIGKIIDADGVVYTTKELRLDTFYIEEKTDTETEEAIPIAEPVTVYDVEYIEPFIFALLSQNLSKEDGNAVVDSGGDAMLTFPYNCDVANGDIVTVLSGTYTQKDVLSRKNAAYDVIPAYFIEEIVYCYGKREFIPGKDFILVGTNRIKWLCDDSPSPGSAYSLTYKIFPTYVITKAIPQVRTSENQRLPKKAVVKLYTSYGEKRGVNVQ